MVTLLKVLNGTFAFPRIVLLLFKELQMSFYIVFLIFLSDLRINFSKKNKKELYEDKIMNASKLISNHPLPSNNLV
jgi:hypothetical protein